MFDDFLTRAFVGGIGVALVAGPMGCFVLWRRLAYFGDTMAHASLLGLVLGLVIGIDARLSVVAVTMAIALAMLALRRLGRLADDAVLGLLSHGTLAIGLVVMALAVDVRIDLMSTLFGDVLGIARSDLAVIWGGGVAVLGCLALIWRPLLAATVDPDLARAEDPRAAWVDIAYVMLLAVTVGIAMRVVGILLITALLIIPAAAAGQLSRAPEPMGVIAALIGAVAVTAGLGASVTADLPAGPAIVVAGLVLFALSLAGRRLRPV